ncbi:hypothetical protein ACFLYO_04790 [Chloroflexota bacterium]
MYTIHHQIRTDVLFGQDSGQAVCWAREVLGADMVIAIGAIADADSADVHIAGGSSMAQAVDTIREQLAKR